MALTANQARLAKNPEMLGKRGLRDVSIADREVSGAGLWTFLCDDARKNGHTCWIRKGVQDSFHCDFVNSRMEQRAHTYKSSQVGQGFTNIVR